MARVTIDDLATRLGLSRASVSYALNGRPGVAEETRMRVTALAVELGWQPSVSARSLSLSRADAFGIVLSRQPEDLGAEPYYMGLLSGIESALSEAGTSLMIRFVPPDPETEAEVYRRWNAERRVDGVILTDLRVDDVRPTLLETLGLPYLVHSGRRTEAGWDFDQRPDARRVVQHLAELGHRRIAHLSGPPILLHERERRAAVAAEGAELGIEVSTIEGDYALETGRSQTAAVLRHRRPPTALVYSNDLMAVGGSAVLREGGRDDVAVVSWDDSLLCQTASPSITALQRDPYGSGRATADRLLRLTGTGRRAEAAEAEAVLARPSRLAVRGSSRPA